VAPAIRRRSATGDEREQLRWFAWALIVFVLAAILAIALTVAGQGIAAGVFGTVAILDLAIGVPLAVGVALLKYRLYQIDAIIRRSVVVGVLAAFITLVYVGVVAGIGSLVGSTRNLPLAVGATAVIALAFQPLRERARRLADRIVYGDRATPYEVLSGFAERISGAYAIEDILPRTVAVLGQGTGAIRADVWLRTGDELRPAATWPSAVERASPRSVVGDDLPAFDDMSVAVPVRHGRAARCSHPRQAGDRATHRRGAAAGRRPRFAGRARAPQRRPRRRPASLAEATRRSSRRGTPQARAKPPRRCPTALGRPGREATARGEPDRP
jgi:hypothetical protein